MPLLEHKFGTWSELKGLFLKFAEAAAVGKPSPFVFRGQADSSWPLRATLDRVQVFESDEAREACRSGLIRKFRRLSAGFIAETIAKHIPAFDRYLPPPRKPWMSEDPRMAVFDAVALALTFLRSVADGGKEAG